LKQNMDQTKSEAIAGKEKAVVGAQAPDIDTAGTESATKVEEKAANGAAYGPVQVLSTELASPSHAIVLK
jgi:hypothetical protein